MPSPSFFENVQNLKEQLVETGYRPGEVDALVLDTVGTTNLEKLTSKQEKLLVETLEDYAAFARKCRRVI